MQKTQRKDHKYNQGMKILESVLEKNQEYGIYKHTPRICHTYLVSSTFSTRFGFYIFIHNILVDVRFGSGLR